MEILSSSSREDFNTKDTTTDTTTNAVLPYEDVLVENEDGKTTIRVYKTEEDEHISRYGE